MSAGRLAGNVTHSLADEAGGPTGHVLPVPQGPESEGDADPLADLRADIAALRGRTALVETAAGGWGEGAAAAPAHDWRTARIGAAPGAPLVGLHDSSARAVLAACGVPSALFDAGTDASGRREAWRQFLHGSLQPLAALVAEELAGKLEAPGLTLGFDRLMASDLQGRARAFQSLTGGGLAAERAAALAGLTG